jgi:hypothetical protein
MPTSTLTLCNDFPDQLGRAVHNLASHTFKAAFTNTAPNIATMAVLADIGQLATGGGYTGGAGGGLTLDSVIYTETTGVGTFLFADEVFTAAGGSVGPFRYVWIYNDSATSPVDALLGYLDYGSAVTLADTESITIDTTTAVLTVTKTP